MSNKSVYGQLMDLNNEEPSEITEIAPVKTQPIKPAKVSLLKAVPQAPPTVEEEKKEAASHSNHDTKQPRHHDTVIPRHHDVTIESIRAAVKHFGKEAATHR